ncbi:MAG: beta-1,4-xylanase [Chitinophagaceae bacterium]|nr:MAG: beta-1,4-xylanase [Chitinophagaceae bacterium]
MKTRLLILPFILMCGFHILYAQETVTPYHTAIPSNIIPKGLGVNIHFTDAKPGEMQMLAEAGFHWVRMDFFWSNIEKKRGVYDFTAYDHLVSSLHKYHLKAIFILDYGNPLYDNGMSPHGPDAIKAFAKWAAASVKHFAGNNFLWEMWNEPNIGFWKPKPDVNEYIHLALATGKAIKKATPDEAFIGPATSGIALDFLKSCFQAGLLQYWDAVSLHPYRQLNPETAVKDYQAVRRLIGKYAPPGKSIPVISGEWGYSAAWKGFDAEKQGSMLAREFLTNLSAGIPLSIWYDWHNDGDNTKDAEDNFGTVNYVYHPTGNPVYDIKPAYLAAKTLMHALDGFHFEKRLPVNNNADYVLLFKKRKNICYTVWTTEQAHIISLIMKSKKYRLLGYTGNESGIKKISGKTIEIMLTNTPQYLIW